MKLFRRQLRAWNIKRNMLILFNNFISFRVKDIGYYYVALTFCMLHENEEAINTFIKHDNQMKMFRVLNLFHNSKPFTSSELVKIMNALFNLASNSGFFYSLEERLDASQKFNFLELLNHEDTKTVKYVILTHPEVIQIVLKILFEINEEEDIKTFFATIIENMTCYSFYNALKCSQVISFL